MASAVHDAKSVIGAAEIVILRGVCIQWLRACAVTSPESRPVDI